MARDRYSEVDWRSLFSDIATRQCGVIKRRYAPATRPTLTDAGDLARREMHGSRLGMGGRGLGSPVAGLVAHQMPRRANHGRLSRRPHFNKLYYCHSLGGVIRV